jgi:hypothetical protein
MQDDEWPGRQGGAASMECQRLSMKAEGRGRQMRLSSVACAEEGMVSLWVSRSRGMSRRHRWERPLTPREQGHKMRGAPSTSCGNAAPERSAASGGRRERALVLRGSPKGVRSQMDEAWAARHADLYKTPLVRSKNTQVIGRQELGTIPGQLPVRGLD